MANTKISDDEMEAMWQFVAERDGATVSQIAEFSGRARASIRDRLNRDSRFRDERTKGANVIFYAVERAPQVDEAQPTASTQPAGRHSGIRAAAILFADVRNHPGVHPAR